MKGADPLEMVPESKVQALPDPREEGCSLAHVKVLGRGLQVQIFVLVQTLSPAK